MNTQMINRIFRLVVLLGTVCFCPNTSADDSATEAPNRSGELRFTLDELELRTQWSGLDDQQAGEIIRGNLYGLIRAVNAYHDANGVLPPAVVPNANIPAEKRLSGLVLLLPYLRRLTYFKDGKDVPIFDAQLGEMAQTLFDSLDLTKGWDDPANVKAARTIVPAFLAPGSASFRDQQGYATSHFAFVRGAKGLDDGAFPEAGGIAIPGGWATIADGTSSTLALGQIQDELGPWTAAGLSTARHVYHPTDRRTVSTFGGRFDGACYFANCDSYVYFLDIAKTPARTLYALTTRDGGEFVETDSIVRFRDATEWKAANRNAKPPN